MSARAPDPRRARNRERLLRAATELFAERGFAETTMDDVAQRAALSRRTAFNHFPSKGDLSVEWAARRQAAATAAVGTPGPGDDVPARLRAWFAALGALTDADPDGTTQMTLGWLAALGPVWHRTTASAQIRDWIATGRDGGTVAADVDPQVAADLLFDAYLGAILRWCAEPAAGRGPVTPRLDVLVGHVLTGLTPR